MDTHSKKQRSYNMSQIKSVNTTPELIVRRLLWANGIRYRINFKKLPGSPDLVFIKRKKVIFINGCFWHKHECTKFKWPKSNIQYWSNKIQKNAVRDQRNYTLLKDLGWDILIIWECEIDKKGHNEVLLKIIKDFLYN